MSREQRRHEDIALPVNSLASISGSSLSQQPKNRQRSSGSSLAHSNSQMSLSPPKPSSRNNK